MIMLSDTPAGDAAAGSQRAPGRLRHDGQGHCEDSVHRYVGPDGRR